MGNVSELIRALAPTELEREVKIKDDAGNVHIFRVKRFAGLADKDKLDKEVENRKKALKLTKDRLAVIVESEDIAGMEPFFSDAESYSEKGKPDRLQFYLTTDTEVMAATFLVNGIAEPVFEWKDAAIFTRVAGDVAIKLLNEAGKFNTSEALEDAKND